MLVCCCTGTLPLLGRAAACYASATQASPGSPSGYRLLAASGILGSWHTGVRMAFPEFCGVRSGQKAWDQMPQVLPWVVAVAQLQHWFLQQPGHRESERHRGQWVSELTNQLHMLANGAAAGRWADIPQPRDDPREEHWEQQSALLRQSFTAPARAKVRLCCMHQPASRVSRMSAHTACTKDPY